MGSDKQFVLVVYDISNDRRRTRLHDRLLDYGSPVQYSVFECLLEAKDLQKMKSAMRRIIRPRKDNVRMYYLCAGCLKKTETFAGQAAEDIPGALVV